MRYHRDDVRCPCCSPIPGPPKHCPRCWFALGPGNVEHSEADCERIRHAFESSLQPFIDAARAL